MSVKISREPDDRIELLFANSEGQSRASASVLRASIGGTVGMGFYLTFRGDPHEVVAMLKAVTEEAERALPAANYEDKRG